ncbi:MAG TPA: class I SAM-dependent methyltransferase [Chloroflexota bacterium]|jgi:SAM-dependent methyltransferase
MEPEQYALLARVEREHWWFRGQRRLAGAVLDAYLAGEPPGRVLDAGCGTGGTTAWLRRYGDVVGVDLAAEAAPFWPAVGLRHAARGSVMALPFRSERFTLVTSFEVLYHRQVPDEAAALAEFWRVLEPGGRLLLRLPAYDWLYGGHDTAVHTRHRYTRDEVIAAVRAAGFVVETATYGNCLLFPLALAKRWSERWRGASQEEMDVPSPVTNAALLGVFGLEAHLAPRWPLPFGLSVLVLARKLGRVGRATPPVDTAALAGAR